MSITHQVNAILKDLKVSSDPSEFMDHPKWNEIKALGKAALPALFEILHTHLSWHLMEMIGELSGEDPVPKEHEGNSVLVAADWLKLGVERGWTTPYTPGPWKGEDWSILGPHGRMVADTAEMYPFSIRDANERLIAAAPEMLEMLKKLQAAAQDGPLLKEVAEVIKKAEGR